MLVVWSDVFKKLLECKRLSANRSDDEISVLKGEVNGRAVTNVRFVGVGLWNAESEAVAPFLHSGNHG